MTREEFEATMIPMKPIVPEDWVYYIQVQYGSPAPQAGVVEGGEAEAESPLI